MGQINQNINRYTLSLIKYGVKKIEIENQIMMNDVMWMSIKIGVLIESNDGYHGYDGSNFIF